MEFAIFIKLKMEVSNYRLFELLSGTIYILIWKHLERFLICLQGTFENGGWHSDSSRKLYTNKKIDTLGFVCNVIVKHP